MKEKNTYTEARKRAVSKYLTETVEEFKVRVPKGQKAYYQAAAASEGLSLNAFVITAMNERIERKHGHEH